jgi:hypothetical protein
VNFDTRGELRPLGVNFDTRGEPRPIGKLFFLCSFFNITKVAQKSGLLFSTEKPMYICVNFDKQWVGLHFGRFFHKLNWSPCSPQTFNPSVPATGLPDFSWHNIPKLGKYTKLPLNLPKGNKIDVPNGRKIGPMAVKCTHIFYCKILQNLPKLRILV